ncbi:SecD/SecF fusion protein [Alteromonadaceae bacterium Bs31]|nr:SecD/SecF fusion protein [Alteromonadaceae bacterium Bs31]
MKSLRSRAILYGLVTVLGLLCALPNLLPERYAKLLPVAYVENTVSLGLDLQGGSHLLLAANFDKLLAAEYESIASNLTAQLRESGIRFKHFADNQNNLVVQLASTEDSAAAMGFVKSLRTLQGGRLVDLIAKGLRLDIALTPQAEEALKKDAIERSLEILRRRLDESGLVEPSITRQGSDYILVQMPGVEDPTDTRKLLGTTAKMSFHWVSQSPGAVGNLKLASTTEGPIYSLQPQVALEGKHIRDAQLGFNPDTGEPVVNFRLDSEGSRVFANMTQQNIGRALAIVLDDAVLTAPVIRGAIPGGSGEISGAFTVKEASELALMLRAGALPVPLDVVEERSVGPDLGSDAVAMGLTTGLAGAAVVFLLMLALYGRWGFLSIISLSISLGLLFGLLSLLGATLTLPGIAGIILTMGMAVDANILINERVREETRLGSPAWKALKAGFERAFATILDSGVTTLIAVSLLFLVGSGPVRGFAVTIGLGLLTSLFTTVGVTRLLMERCIKGHERQALQMQGLFAQHLFSNKIYNFLRGRVVGLVFSAVLSFVAIVLYIEPGLEYGVDFTGGTAVEVLASNIGVEQLRTQLALSDLAGAAIQEFEQAGRYLVRLPAEHGDPAFAAQQVSSLKNAVIALEVNASFPRVDMVGPKVSGGFADATLLAILLAGAGMLLYLWYRFESHFALAATFTIALDLTKTIGFFALTGVEFNLTAVAALLALIGYSVNDKVVVFDRIRENLRKTPDKPILTLLNESISSTLTRTVFTSTTTFIALLPMGIVGGAAVASFALPMLFGIVIGTSSSMFVAAPILYYLSERRLKRGQRLLRPTPDELQEQLEHIP